MPKEGISFYKKYYIEHFKEIKQFILFGVIEKFELYETWIEEYEKNLGKIGYRESIKEQYKEKT